MNKLLLLTMLLSCSIPRQTPSFLEASEPEHRVYLDRGAYENLGLTDDEVDALMKRHAKEIGDWLDDHYDLFLEEMQE